MRRLTLAVAGLALIVAAATGCDNDGDGYDDDTGQALPISVTYTWEGSGATYFDGTGTVHRDTGTSMHGSATGVIQPGHNASVTVDGVTPACGIRITGPVATGTSRCSVPASKMWSRGW